MIEFAGLIYDVVKDLKDYWAWEEKEKLVEIHWPELSGFQKRAEADGLRLSWSKPDKVATRELDGYEVMYEVNKLKRERNKLVTRDGLVLLGKRNAD